MNNKLRSRYLAATMVCWCATLLQSCALSDRQRILLNDGRWDIDKDLTADGNVLLKKGSVLIISNQFEVSTDGHSLGDFLVCDPAKKQADVKWKKDCIIDPASGQPQVDYCATFQPERFHLIGAMRAGNRNYCVTIKLEDPNSDQPCAPGIKECALLIERFGGGVEGGTGEKRPSPFDGGGGGVSIKPPPRPNRVIVPSAGEYR